MRRLTTACSRLLTTACDTCVHLRQIKQRFLQQPPSVKRTRYVRSVRWPATHCDPAFLTAWCASVFPKPRTIWWRQNDDEDPSSARNSLPVQDPSLPAQCRSHNDVKSVCPAGFNPLTAQSFGQGHSAAEARPDVRSKGQSIWSHRSRVCMSCDIKSHRHIHYT